MHNGTEVLENLGFGTTEVTVLYDYLGLVVLWALGSILGYFGIRRQVRKQGFY